jgi:hypothetical protein
VNLAACVPKLGTLIHAGFRMPGICLLSTKQKMIQSLPSTPTTPQTNAENKHAAKPETSSSPPEQTEDDSALQQCSPLLRYSIPQVARLRLRTMVFARAGITLVKPTAVLPAKRARVCSFCKVHGVGYHVDFLRLFLV